jgi:hypothetical protein
LFRLDVEREHLPVEPPHIVALYQSVNTASVVLPGVPATTARAVVVGFRSGESFDVAVGLHLTKEERHLVFTHDEGPLDSAGARQMAKEALSFVEAMGFFMENVNWRDLGPSGQHELLEGLKVFHPPTGARAASRAVADPRTKLARLLAQF